MHLIKIAKIAKGCTEKPLRFVQIGYVCRKAAHYVRYQTPQGSDNHPINQIHIRGLGPVSRYLHDVVGSETLLAVIPEIQEKLQWQTDTGPVEVAWALVRERGHCASFLESLHGQIPNLKKLEFRASLDGKQA